MIPKRASFVKGAMLYLTLLMFGVCGAIQNDLIKAFFNNYRTIVMLVDSTEEAHEDASRFALKSTGQVELVLMKFSTSDATPVLMTNHQNAALFEELLKWPGSHETSSYVGEDDNGTALFYGVLRASQVVPLSGAILIFTDRNVRDEDLANLALREVLKKRARIYVLWGGMKNDAAKILMEAATLSGGGFFNSGRGAKIKTAAVVQPVVLFRKHASGKQKFSFPLNAGVSKVHVSLSTPISSAVLTSPNGDVIDLLNSTDVEAFSEGSFLAKDVQSYEIELVTADVGVWQLYADGTLYNVTVSMLTELTFSPTETTSGSVTLESSLPIKGVEKVALVDEHGRVLKENVRFTRKKEDLVEGAPTTADNGVNIETDNVPDAFYVKIDGTDGEGNEFSRLSYVDTRTRTYTLPAITVEVGIGSQLLAMPNQYVKLYFEVTNNRDQTVFARFRCHDDKSLLVSMLPISTWLTPKQTVIVTVTARTPYTTSAGFKDLITFTVTGVDVIEKSVVMSVSNEYPTDYDEPYLTHKYTSDCLNVLLGNCQDGTWAISVTAQDSGSGLLQVTSAPVGLYFPNGYVAGTTEQVTGYYSGSCCQSKLQISATDRAGNRKSYTADAYYSYLSAGSIAAIVLAAVLLILIIVGIVVLCKTKCCKQKDSVDLPTYRGPSSRRY